MIRNSGPVVGLFFVMHDAYGEFATPISSKSGFSPIPPPPLYSSITESVTRLLVRSGTSGSETPCENRSHANLLLCANWSFLRFALSFLAVPTCCNAARSCSFRTGALCVAVGNVCSEVEKGRRSLFLCLPCTCYLIPMPVLALVLVLCMCCGRVAGYVPCKLGPRRITSDLPVL